ncbi:hypothetical protein [Aggregatibacter actinomycetemcomitans]|nr:hypothetical protein [Aggregatibacter actinomycetemcomitans]MBN6072964.1 hypothetical protein [Aggregatibacter actinomycetemcomitans]
MVAKIFKRVVISLIATGFLGYWGISAVLSGVTVSGTGVDIPPKIRLQGQ